MITDCNFASVGDVADILSDGNVCMFIPNRADRALADGKCEERTYRSSPDLLRCHPDYEFWWTEAMVQLLGDRDYLDLSREEQMRSGSKAERMLVTGAWIWALTD